MEFFVLLLTLIVPGIIAAKLYSFIFNCRTEFNILNSLGFDLLIFIINITGLYYLKDIQTFQSLLTYFDCMSFTRKYALLAILVGLILATIFGLIRRYVFWWRRCDS